MNQHKRRNATKPARAASRRLASGTAAKGKTRDRRGPIPFAVRPDGMPVKPVITSAANLSYQGRFDTLARMAEAGDWKGVAAYKVTGVNSYSKMVARYRDGLLAARLSVHGPLARPRGPQPQAARRADSVDSPVKVPKGDAIRPAPAA